MTAHQSTQEEIEARRAEVAAAECKGDGVHSTDMRFWHDWRLWQRDPRYDTTPDYDRPSWPLIGYTEVWYCTRCRKIEEKTVMIGGS